jgi:hypothetical protein
MDKTARNRFVLYVLGALQVFIGVTAILGGFELVSDPSGAKIHVPQELLKNSPFTDYLIPGLVLLMVNGVGNVLAGIVTFLRNRNAGNLAIFFGVFLVLFISIEVLVVGLQNISQPLYFVLGGVELALGLKLSKSFKRGHEDFFQSRDANLPA